MKILVAEDDQISRKLLSTTLKQFGHEVKAFDNGADAWAYFDESPVRVIVSDWLMPDLDGLDFCRKVRKRAQTQYTYFILLTANVQGKDTYLEAMNAGIDDFLAKPLDRDQIWMRLKVAERILKYTTTINKLESMLPICSYCKKVRDDNNYWQQVETYLANRTGTSFSHSVCPTCYTNKVKPEIDKIRAQKNH
jgi:DNA-binding response OmpR family regulator